MEPVNVVLGKKGHQGDFGQNAGNSAPSHFAASVGIMKTLLCFMN